VKATTACEFIADTWRRTGYQPDVTAEQIFNYSPRGELFMIWQWYDEAVLVSNHLGWLPTPKPLTASPTS
jgi:hypothetical protein